MVDGQRRSLSRPRSISAQASRNELRRPCRVLGRIVVFFAGSLIDGISTWHAAVGLCSVLAFVGPGGRRLEFRGVLPLVDALRQRRGGAVSAATYKSRLELFWSLRAFLGVWQKPWRR